MESGNKGDDKLITVITPAVKKDGQPCNATTPSTLNQPLAMGDVADVGPER